MWFSLALFIYVDIIYQENTWVVQKTISLMVTSPLWLRPRGSQQCSLVQVSHFTFWFSSISKYTYYIYQQITYLLYTIGTLESCDLAFNLEPLFFASFFHFCSFHIVLAHYTPKYRSENIFFLKLHYNTLLTHALIHQCANAPMHSYK